MLKKVLAVVLSALMVLSLAACGGSSSAPAADAAPAAEAAKEEKAADTAAPAADGETLKFWGVEVASWTPAFEELLAGFEAETGIKVEAEFYPYEESEAKFQTSMLLVDVPPIFTVPFSPNT